MNGIVITAGAGYNLIGNGTASGRNLISGNTYDGIRIEGSDTLSNTVQGNYISTNQNGTAAMPNGANGVELTNYTQGNLVRGNPLSGDLNPAGFLILDHAHHNTVLGNILQTRREIIRWGTTRMAQSISRVRRMTM